jgi:hypothetical protein
MLYLWETGTAYAFALSGTLGLALNLPLTQLLNNQLI